MTVSVRLGRASDAEDVARLTSQLGYDVDVAAVRDKLPRILARPDQHFLVAQIESEPVGWLHAAVWEDIEAEPFVVIAGLVVDRNHRRRGIGRMLLERAEEWATRQGCHLVRLWSSSTRTRAHQFYERLGYEKVKLQYAFAKSLDPARRATLTRLVPRVEG